MGVEVREDPGWKSRHFKGADVEMHFSCKGEQEKVLEREMGVTFVDDLRRNCIELGL